MAEVLLTQRAKSDIQEIYQYSIEEFGLKTANEYLDKIELALQLLNQQPELLLFKANISQNFKLFKAVNHWLVCDRIDDSIFVLTVKHSSMNLFERLNDLKPKLDQELQFLRKGLKSI